MSSDRRYLFRERPRTALNLHRKPASTFSGSKYLAARVRNSSPYSGLIGNETRNTSTVNSSLSSRFGVSKVGKSSYESPITRIPGGIPSSVSGGLFNSRESIRQRLLNKLERSCTQLLMPRSESTRSHVIDRAIGNVEDHLKSKFNRGISSYEDSFTKKYMNRESDLFNRENHEVKSDRVDYNQNWFKFSNLEPINNGNSRNSNSLEPGEEFVPERVYENKGPGIISSIFSKISEFLTSKPENNEMNKHPTQIVKEAIPGDYKELNQNVKKELKQKKSKKSKKSKRKLKKESHIEKPIIDGGKEKRRKKKEADQRHLSLFTFENATRKQSTESEKPKILEELRRSSKSSSNESSRSVRNDSSSTSREDSAKDIEIAVKEEQLKQKNKQISELNTKVKVLETSLVDIQKNLIEIKQNQKKNSFQLISSTPASNNQSKNSDDNAEVLKSFNLGFAYDHPVSKKLTLTEKLINEQNSSSSSQASMDKEDEISTESTNEAKKINVHKELTTDNHESHAGSEADATLLAEIKSPSYNKITQELKRISEKFAIKEKQNLVTPVLEEAMVKGPQVSNGGDEFDETNIDETLAKIERSVSEFSPVKMKF